MKDNDQKKSLSLKNTSSVSKSTICIKFSRHYYSGKAKKNHNAESLSDNKATKNHSTNKQSKQNPNPQKPAATTNTIKPNDSQNVRKNPSMTKIVLLMVMKIKNYI